jgi:selenocysteine lyase/cysteine desulfurase
MMDIHHNVPAPSAQRFQAGTPPVPNCYAAAAGLDIILGLGTRAIEEHIRRITALCMDRLLEAGCRLATPREDSRRGPTVAIRATDDNALVARLAEADIVTSSRDGNVRAMFHCYNNEADVETLVRTLIANRALLKK